MFLSSIFQFSRFFITNQALKTTITDWLAGSLTDYFNFLIIKVHRFNYCDRCGGHVLLVTEAGFWRYGRVW
jgi:hypothetical protein